MRVIAPKSGCRKTQVNPAIRLHFVSQALALWNPRLSHTLPLDSQILRLWPIPWHKMSAHLEEVEAPHETFDVSPSIPIPECHFSVG